MPEEREDMVADPSTLYQFGAFRHELKGLDKLIEVLERIEKSLNILAHPLYEMDLRTGESRVVSPRPMWETCADKNE